MMKNSARDDEIATNGAGEAELSHVQNAGWATYRLCITGTDPGSEGPSVM